MGGKEAIVCSNRKTKVNCIKEGRHSLGGDQGKKDYKFHDAFGGGQLGGKRSRSQGKDMDGFDGPNTTRQKRETPSRKERYPSGEE